MQLKNRLKSDRITVYCRCDEIGNHASLKMMWAQALVGSSPTSGTNIKLSMIIADGKAIAQKVLSQIKTGLDGSRWGIATLGNSADLFLLPPFGRVMTRQPLVS